MTTYGGREWYYEFRQVPNFIYEESLQSYADETQARYDELARHWDEVKNSEWLCRIYLSMKMIFSSSLFLGSAGYAKGCNLRVPVSYLEYYAAFNAVRSVHFTMSSEKWANGEMVTLSHQKVLKPVGRLLSAFDGSLAERFDTTIQYLKAKRELISYRSPSRGDAHCGEDEIDVLELCTLLSEIAQINSELLQQALNQTLPYGATFEGTYIQSLGKIKVNRQTFIDREDLYRLNYLERKCPVPVNIMFMMTEGHVEDFFGAWCHDEPQPEMFDPDDYWQIIFDIP